MRTRRNLATEAVRGFSELAGYVVPLASLGSEDDYNGMDLEEWKAAIRRDVEQRFGPMPDDLRPACEPGWDG